MMGQLYMPVLEVTGHHWEFNVLFYHHQNWQIMFQCHTTLRDIASHQTGTLHDTLVDKLLLGGASVTVLKFVIVLNHIVSLT